MSNLFSRSKNVGQLAKQTTCYATAVTNNTTSNAGGRPYCPPPKMFAVKENLNFNQKSNRFEELFYGSPVPVQLKANYQNPTKYGDYQINGRTSDF